MESCIPEGTYPLEARYAKKFGNHLLVKNVPQRELILFYPTDYGKNARPGCIAPVSELFGVGKGSGSRLAMQRVLSLCHQAYDRKETVLLTIKSNHYELNGSI